MNGSGNDAATRSIPYTDFPTLVGTELGLSDWLRIDQDRVDLFADASGDHQWIHVDVDRATREIGGPIAHGALVFSLIPLLRETAFRVEGHARTINYGSDKVRFLTPVPVGASIRLRSHLLRATTVESGIQAAFQNVIEISAAARPACVAETISLFLAG